MPMKLDFSFCRGIDGNLDIQLVPSTNVGGKPFAFEVMKHFGGESGLITKNVASGYSSASGIAVLSSGEGRFRIALWAPDTSGLPYGNYSYQFREINSGQRSVLTEGFISIRP